MQAAPIKLGKLNYSSGYSLNWSVGQCLIYISRMIHEVAYATVKKPVLKKTQVLRSKIQKITPPMLK